MSILDWSGLSLRDKQTAVRAVVTRSISAPTNCCGTLRTAKLHPVKTLESFDFSFQPSLDRERIAALAQLDFIRRAEVVHFLGPPGTGKSHLATALGVAAVKAGRQVYRASLAELIDGLARAERHGQLTEMVRFYARAALLIVPPLVCRQPTAGQWTRSATCPSARAAPICSSSW
ncbi:ATP-binding protein [uncultured Jannaschia sp.]|uniref:ATP-binding protein n=1 Tax=uncultured Jannaschia sp. TaxID=293347 RepID=UPI0026120A77|nr:ATP-binding protein [uncultured Jannaschia sp.]